MSMRGFGSALAIAAAAFLAMGIGPCDEFGFGDESFHFEDPNFGQLYPNGDVDFSVRLPGEMVPGSLEVTVIDDAGLPVAVGAVTQLGQSAFGTLSELGAGRYLARAQVLQQEPLGVTTRHAITWFEVTELASAAGCEILNGANCMLPYTSSQFLEPANTPTGFRLNFPDAGLPIQTNLRNPPFLPAHLSPEPYRVLDGFSPTVQILMHFPGGVDVSEDFSNASRLLEDSRSYGTRSLDPDSPTLLIDAESGERILHFVEPDARAVGSPDRQVLFLRPGRSLTPGRRYVVAARNLRHPDGSRVRPEAVFAALRDQRPSSIPEVEARRAQMEEVFAALRNAGVPRRNLTLAFDFVVESDHSLTHQMLSMRDEAFAWLDAQAAAGVQTFSVDSDPVDPSVCPADPAEGAFQSWKFVSGSFQVPLYLRAATPEEGSPDPIANPRGLSFLNVAEDGSETPVQNGFYDAPYGISIPCSVFYGNPVSPLIFGHGLFGSGPSSVAGFLAQGFAEILEDYELADSYGFIPGATDWSGLSSRDIDGFTESYIVADVLFDLNNIGSLADRLRQGQLATQVLSRMMKKGMFNVAPEFQTPAGQGVFPGPEGEMYYFGVSLGGVMGLMYAALSQDVTRVNVDVPSINFSFLLQRATPFLQFEDLLLLTSLGDPMDQAILNSLIHELWVRGESAGYATHITGNTFDPQTPAKHVLMTVAYLDQQVSNQGAEISARTLGLPMLEGSLLSGIAEIPDRAGPLDGAMVIYHTASFDLDNPAHEPFIPPLANRQARVNHCDPHGRRTFIPASLEQLVTFFQPGGQIENFCDGLCDADPTVTRTLSTGEELPIEMPFGDPVACDPLAP